jgi:cell division protein FtsB
MTFVRRGLLPLMGLAVAAVFLLTFVFPTRTLLTQRTSISRAEQQLQVLEEQRAALASRADELQKDTEIERLAREQYNLVRPGEEAYALLPQAGAHEAATAPVDAPPAHRRNVLQRAWDTVTSLF